MFKITVIENQKDHKGNFFFGFVNDNGKDLTFETSEAAQAFIKEHSDFFSEFRSAFVTLA
mgnify:CR=1 FL=1|tara:strand:- start:97 stop:276 length:180 start_codon:yes stop_codon:yes gene_type:complete